MLCHSLKSIIRNNISIHVYPKRKKEEENRDKKQCQLFRDLKEIKKKKALETQTREERNPVNRKP